MEFPQNCANCLHFDRDAYCTLPLKTILIDGYINDPRLVVCAKHEPQTPDDASDIPEA